VRGRFSKNGKFSRRKEKNYREEREEALKAQRKL